MKPGDLESPWVVAKVSCQQEGAPYKASLLAVDGNGRAFP